MATVNLGSIKFKWKGTYAGGTAYTIDDVVSYNGSSYICILASTGNLPTNATYFEQMSSAGTNGTNGTDLGTTLTTQGDLVYRDGSGLQRLGAGTAGQVLQTGGAGANPSWGTVSSDYVKLYEGSNLTANTITVDGYFTSDYDKYVLEVIGYNGQGSSTGTRLSVRFIEGGSQLTSNYYYTGDYHYASSSGNNWSNGWQVSWNNYSFIDVGYFHDSAGTGKKSDTTFTFFRPQTNKSHSYNYASNIWDGANTIGWIYGAGHTATNQLATGLAISVYSFGSGTLEVDKIKLYGVK
jgi:hypothetical protein